MARLTTGPVIGLVTTTTARVLVDCSVPARVTVTATAVGNAADTHRFDLQTLNARPVGVAKLAGLTPRTTYRVAIAVDGVDDPTRTGRFRTVDPDARRHELLVMSCCDADHHDTLDLHDLAAQRHANTDTAAAIALHVGDQVYADKIFRGCIAMIEDRPRETWPDFRPAIVAQYRSLYRFAWNQPGIRRLLANTMNLMIWDDHEITDDWADGGVFHDATHPQHFVARCGWQVYREYQRQLWEDVADAPDAPYGQHEGHAHAWGWLGTLFIDVRGGRAFRDQGHGSPYLSPAQWGQINLAFDPAVGTFRDCKLVVVASPVPPVFFGPRATANYEGDADDLRGHWSFGAHTEELYRLLELLQRWKTADPRREVVIVSGDVHVGAIISVCDRSSRAGNRRPMFQELISSPVRLPALSSFRYNMFTFMLRNDPLLFRRKPWFSSRVDQLQRLESFGVVKATVDAAGKARAALSLVDS